ncbi:hypothetical protein ACLOJK_029212, partial [Asimina triloba]
HRRSTGFGAPSSSSSRQPWLPAMGFSAKPPTANRSRPSRRPHPEPHPTIATDGYPFFHDAKSRWVETHLAAQQPASAHMRQRLPLSSEPAAPDSSLRPPCPDPAVLFPLPRARQPAPLSQINPRSSIHGDQSTITWHASVRTPSARASVLTIDSSRQPDVHIRFFGAWHHIMDRKFRAKDPTKRKQLAGVSIPPTPDVPCVA